MTLSARTVGTRVAAAGVVRRLGLLAIVAARIVAFDRHRVFMLVDSYTLWIYLPAYPIAIAAVLFRARAIAIAAGIVVIAHLVWVVPPVFRTVAVPGVAAWAPHLRVASANLNFDNGDHAPLIAELARDHVDVIFLQELTPAVAGDRSQQPRRALPESRRAAS